MQILIRILLEAIFAIWFNYLGMSFSRSLTDVGASIAGCQEKKGLPINPVLANEKRRTGNA